MLTTLLSPTSGSALICNYDVVKDSLGVRRKIGYLPENVKFYENLTAFENLDYLAKVVGLSKTDKKIKRSSHF